MPGQASSPNPQSGRRPIVQSSSRPFNRPHAVLTRPVFRNHQRSWSAHGVCPSLYGCRCVQIGACPSRYAGRSRARHGTCSDRSGTARAACRASLHASWHRMSCPGTRGAEFLRDRTSCARACEFGHRSSVIGHQVALGSDASRARARRFACRIIAPSLPVLDSAWSRQSI